MELTEGCKMFCTSPRLIKEYGLGEIGVLIGNSYKGRFYYDNGASVDALFVVSGPEKQNFEIIGHDITFAAVCLAIGEHFGGQLVDLHVHENGFCRLTLPNQGSHSCVFDLGKPLHLQKPEVWEFLFQLFNLKES